MYLCIIPDENGFYGAPNSLNGPNSRLFSAEFLPEFNGPEGAAFSGCVDITYDDEKILTCVWNEERYQSFMENVEIASPDPEPEPEQPTTEERLAALEKENKMLQAQLEASIQSNQMLEDCLVEMAGVVYA